MEKVVVCLIVCCWCVCTATTISRTFLESLMALIIKSSSTNCFASVFLMLLYNRMQLWGKKISYWKCSYIVIGAATGLYLRSSTLHNVYKPCITEGNKIILLKANDRKLWINIQFLGVTLSMLCYKILILRNVSFWILNLHTVAFVKRPLYQIL